MSSRSPYPTQRSSEWSMPGYTVVKTKHYISKSFSFSPSSRGKVSSEAKAKASYPDPAKYGETIKQTFEKYWKRPNGLFSKMKKKTYVDEIISRSKSIPGPGSYNKSVSKDFDPKRRSVLGKFDKSERASFVSSIECSAEETPASWKYKPNMPEKRIYNMWSKPKENSGKKQSEIGPGKYEGIIKAYNKILKNSPNFSFSRSKTPSVYQDQARKSQAIPGVGAYKNSELAYDKYKLKKQRTPVIFPYKIRRFTETVMKKSAETPGPGSYEIIPPIKRF